MKCDVGCGLEKCDYIAYLLVHCLAAKNCLPY